MKNGSISVQPSPRIAWLASLSLAVAAFILYLVTLAPAVLEADAGEFQFVAWLPGIAHPPGYPLYILLGWLWTHLLPVGLVAWRMNLLSALLAAVAVGLVYGVARRMLDLTLPMTPGPARALAAAVAAATFAVTPTFWSQAVIAEVYALHLLFVAAALWLALGRCSQNRPWPGRYSYLLAFLLGLALTHHPTIILLFPAIFLFLRLTPAPPESRLQPETGLKLLAIHLLLLLLPLLLYLYLPLVAPATPYAVLNLSQTQPLVLYENSVRGFWQHVTATVFTDQLRPAAVGVDRLWLVWQLLQQQVGWAGLGLALLGLLTLWRQRQAGLLWLTSLAFLTVVGFNLIYFIGDVFVLFIPAWLFVCLWIGAGVLGLADGVARQFIRSKTGVSEDPLSERMQERLGRNIYRIVAAGLPVFFFGLPVLLLIIGMAGIDQSHNLKAQQQWQELLAEPLPEAAVLISNDRNEIMPLWYYQYVEGIRPDLLGLFPLIVPDPAYSNTGRLLDQALASGRSVYLIKPMEGLDIKARIMPEGKLFRVMAQDTIPAYESNLALPEIALPAGSGAVGQRTETIMLLGYDLAPANQLQPGDEITVTLYWQPVQALTIDYTSYVHLLNSAGQGMTQSDHRPGGVYYPSSNWQEGEILIDRHRLTLPGR
jgi:hypothetical protein